MLSVSIRFIICAGMRLLAVPFCGQFSQAAEDLPVQIGVDWFSLRLRLFGKIGDRCVPATALRANATQMREDLRSAFAQPGGFRGLARIRQDSTEQHDALHCVGVAFSKRRFALGDRFADQREGFR